MSVLFFDAAANRRKLDAMKLDEAPLKLDEARQSVSPLGVRGRYTSAGDSLG